MFKNILNTLGVKILSSFVSFYVLILTTNHLGAAGRGTLSLLSASLGIVALFNGFLGGTSLVYLLPRNRSKGFLFQALKISYLWAVVVSLIGAMIYIVVVGPNGVSAVHLLILGVLVSVASVNKLVLLSNENIKIFNTSDLIQLFLNVGLFGAIIWIFDKLSVGSVIVTMYVTTVAGIIFTAVYMLRGVSGHGEKGEASSRMRETAQEMMKYGFVAQLGNVIQFLNYRLCFFVLNSYGSVADVGVYSVGVALSEAVWMVAGSIALIQYAKITNMTDQVYARKITLRLAKLSFCVTLISLVIMLAVPAGVFASIFGRDFRPVKGIMMYLSVGIAVFGYTVIISHYFAGIGKYKINTFAAIIGLAVTVSFNFLLIPKYGFVGAGVSASLSYLTTGVFLIVMFLKETGSSFRLLLPDGDDLSFIIEKLSRKPKTTFGE